ncbi:spermidine/putrescine ABC transporter, permease protein [Roseovarius sp. TM1035]|uniref:ABC transporter permease n=1 Tax=Roseovarius TaxID=74030 RepID=UPI0001556F86|nr:ABC transporter permease [Roseovarius sp. TM1035]AWZ21166.1 Spermidine Putrescine ABC transporter permease component PotB [Roseovarius sp. AK1035]EDM33049.1 spermidine/putrescine ABC transporter, permease protein [Roseovarius sp. TM1035]
MAETSLPKSRTADRPPRASGSRILRLFQRSESARGYLMMGPTLAIMTFGIVVPFVILLVISLWTRQGFGFDTTLTLNNYIRSWNEPIYGTLMLRSFWMSGLATVATVLLCYPMAYFVAFHVHRNKMLWIILMTLPFWTSYLLRVFAWKVILGYEGVINSGLMSVGLIEAPLSFLLYSPTAVIITLAHAWAAFAILPLYVSLEKIDRSLLEAATDLGDGPMARFFRVTLPLSMPGVIAASFLIFIPTTGDYITPALLGGPDGAMIGNLIQLQFGAVNNWPMGATLSIVLMFWIAALALVFLLVTRKVQGRIT